MPAPKKTIEPKGTVYQILVSKLGHDNDDWVAGKQITDTDFPDIDFEWLLSVGAVAKVREDGSVVTPPVAVPSAPAIEPEMGLQEGQPHTETPIATQQIGLPVQPSIMSTEKDTHA